MDTDEATRVRQGACASTSPEILRDLANDPSVTVRASLALNPALPDQVSAILAADTDERVRTDPQPQAIDADARACPAMPVSGCSATRSPT